MVVINFFKYWYDEVRVVDWVEVIVYKDVKYIVCKVGWMKI